MSESVRKRVIARKCLRAVGLAGMLLPLGCNNLRPNQATAQADPLLGGLNAPAAGARPLPGPTQPAPSPSVNTPPLSSANPTSNAALAAGAFQPLSGGSELSIGGGGPSAVRLQAPTFTPANAPPPPVQPLAPTAPIAVVTAPAESSPAAPAQPTFRSSPTGGRVMSIDQAQVVLERHNVRWQRIDRTPAGEWKFSCSIPDRQDPSKSRTYVAEAATQLGAYQAALERIAREQN